MKNRFDFVIVGAGSAGCVLANRLSHEQRNRVLLIEAGGSDWNPWIHIPLGFGKLFNSKRENWLDYTVAVLENRKIFQPRGKVIGGSSSINGLVYVRGQREDYDHWERLGNSGWGYTDLLPYFLMAEDQAHGLSSFHGTGGPLHVEDVPDRYQICDSFIEAAQQAGYPRNDDFNSAGQEGAGYFQMTTKRGVRQSTAKAYLKPVMKRRNLEVVTHAHVTRVVTDKGRAVGVEFLSNGHVRKVSAEREVIVCAGAIGSPQILQLSGIGSPDLLRNLDIPVAASLPGVGRNLQDHYRSMLVFRAIQGLSVNDSLRTFSGKFVSGIRYLVGRRGPLAISAGIGGGFFRTGSDVGRPDLQISISMFSTTEVPGRLDKFSGFTASQLRPESRGTVSIKSANPLIPPVIQMNYLSTPKDREMAVIGIRLMRDIATRPGMRAVIEEEILPGQSALTDAQLLSHAKERGGSIFHPVGTCRMGSDDDAVVDRNLRVRGMEKLRVVDASVMPTLISGNTNATTIAIAEKAASMILNE